MDVKRRIRCFNLILLLITIALFLSDKCILAKSFSVKSFETKLSGKAQHDDVGGNIYPLEVKPSNKETFSKKKEESLNFLENYDVPLEEELSSVHYGVSFVQYQTTQATSKTKSRSKRRANYSPIYPQLPSAPTWQQSNYNPSASNYPYQHPNSSNSYHPSVQNSFNHYPTPYSNQFYPNSYNQNNTQNPGYNQPSSFYAPYNPNTPYQPYTPNNGPNRYNLSNPGNFNQMNCSNGSPYSQSNLALCSSNNTFYPQRPGQSTYLPNINPSYPPPHNWNGQQGVTTYRYPSYTNSNSQRPPQYNNTNGPPNSTPYSYFNPNATNTNYPPYNRFNQTNYFNPFGTQSHYSTPSYGQNPYQKPYNATGNNYGQNSLPQSTNPYSPYNSNGYNQNGQQSYNPVQTPLAPYPPNSNFSNSKPFNRADMAYPSNSNNPHHRY